MKQLISNRLIQRRTNESLHKSTFQWTNSFPSALVPMAHDLAQQVIKCCSQHFVETPISSLDISSIIQITQGVLPLILASYSGNA